MASIKGCRREAIIPHLIFSRWPRSRLILGGLLALTFSGVVIAFSHGTSEGPNTAQDSARQILEATGIHGGLIVHLGCGNGLLTEALRTGENDLVQGLDADAETVGQARRRLQQQHLYGPVSVDQFNGQRLPYVDNLVNLLLAEDLRRVSSEEALRVLAPGGVLYTKQDGQWRKIIKPRPAGIDEWTHFLHDASGNAVGHDQVVGPPGRLQWSAGPTFTRSHEHTPSLEALVSSGGRIFYIVDEATIASLRFDPQWQLVARDAFNGLVLWKKTVSQWFPHIINWGNFPLQLERKLVAVGDRVYVSLGLLAPVSVLDAVTGRELAVLPHSQGTEEIVFHEGVLLLAVRGVTDDRVAELARWQRLLNQETAPLPTHDAAAPLVQRLRRSDARAPVTIEALDANSGELLWKVDGEEAADLKPNTLSASGPRVFFELDQVMHDRDLKTGKPWENGEVSDAGVVYCRDLKTGKPQWNAKAGTLRVVDGDRVICSAAKTITALSAVTGKTLWTQKPRLCEIFDSFVIGDSLWLGGFKPFEGRTSGKRGPVYGPYYLTQHALATGAVLREIESENPGHHHRCYRNKATDRYVLAGRRGTEFIDLQTGDVLWNSWARGVCKYGVMPCNGLLYVPPHACTCYVAAKLAGFNVLAPQRKKEATTPTTDETPQVEQGPAYASICNSQSQISNPYPSDWPTYRADADRSGATAMAVPAALAPRWQVKVAERITAPTVADGKVFVASVDRQCVIALNAASGRPAWQFTAGARVDSPPTLDHARAIFGCRDGCVYSLRTADGALAWRLHAARQDRRAVVNGQLESVSPVHGSVLVRDGVAYVTAGRSSYLDDGIDLLRVEPKTGTVLSTTPIYSPDPQTGRQPPQSAPYAIPGARSDILSSDGRCVYLRDAAFTPEGQAAAQAKPHLLTLTDFLDDSWAHRSYWIFGTECSVSGGCCKRDKDLTFGRLLVFDAATVYGYGRTLVHWSDQFADGPYRLFARDKTAAEPRWEKRVPAHVRAMVLAGRTLFVVSYPLDRPAKVGEGLPVTLGAYSADDGAELAHYRLAAPPVFDGMAAAGGCLYIALENGEMLCMAKAFRNGHEDASRADRDARATRGSADGGIQEFDRGAG